MASSSATSWGVLGREGPLRRDPLAGVVLRLGSGSQGEQGVLNGRLPPLGPPMGALVPLQPGGRNHGAPDAANAFAALVSGEIGAGGALAEQTDHQSLRESEERRFAWPAAWAASVKLHRRTPSGGAGQRGGVCNGGFWLGLVAGGWWLDHGRQARGRSSAKLEPNLPWIGLGPRREQRSDHQQQKVAE